MTLKQVKQLKIIQILVLASFFATTKNNFLVGLALLFTSSFIESLLPKQYTARIGEGNRPRSVFIDNSVKYSYWVESIIGFGLAILLAYIFWLLRDI